MASTRRRNRITAGVAITLGMAASLTAGLPSAARAGDYQVYSPNVTRGEKEVELRGFTSQGTGPNTGTEKAVRASVGYSPTDFWATELYANAEQEPGETLKLEEYEWENRFQLTPQGKYPVDLGLLSEIEIPRFSHDPYEVKLGPSLARDFGRVTAQLNLFAARQYGTNAQPGVELSYRSRLLYRYERALSPEIEAYGQPVGRFGDWGSPRNQIGPGLTGQVIANDGGKWRYSAVLLFGATTAAADTTLVGRLEYEFY